MVRLGGWVHRLGFPEDPVLLAVASGPMRGPPIEEHCLLVWIGDAGAYLGEEIQGIEHPEVPLVPRVDNV